MLSMFTAHGLFVVSVACFTTAAALSDLRTRRLPNWLTVSGLVAALVFHVATAGWSGLATAVAGFALGFGVLLVLWLIGGGGGGDVKLMGALGAWLGPQATLCVFVLSALLAALACLVEVGLRWASKKTNRVDRSSELDPAASASHRRAIPYALPVAMGTWLLLAWQSLPH